MAKRADITAAQVRAILDYNPETGEFFWRERPAGHFRTSRTHKWWNSRYAGKRAGCPGGNGYRNITINNRHYRANRLAWLYMTGEWPCGEVDHENRKIDDDRWDNLRDATHTQNIANTKTYSSNTSGFKGVHWHKRLKKWRSEITISGKKHHLGLFINVEDAHYAYALAAKKIHGKFARA